LLLPLAALLPVLALLIAHITRRELASVGTLVTQIRERGATTCSRCKSGAARRLQGISDSTNHLLQRLADALDTERALAANAAHELRTPLATTRLRLQAALGHALSPQARSEVQEALASLTRLGLRAEKLLQLSRAESGAALARERVNLAEVAASVAQEFWADPALLQRLRLQVPEERSLGAGDFDALAIAARNLVENAVRYAPASPITWRWNAGHPARERRRAGHCARVAANTANAPPAPDTRRRPAAGNARLRAGPGHRPHHRHTPGGHAGVDLAPCRASPRPERGTAPAGGAGGLMMVRSRPWLTTRRRLGWCEVGSR
jgi:hypothetical protein